MYKCYLCMSSSSNGLLFSVPQLEGAGKTSRISGCKDSSISTSKPVIDLVDAIKPGAINYELVLDAATEEVSKITNCFYS